MAVPGFQAFTIRSPIFQRQLITTVEVYPAFAPGTPLAQRPAGTSCRGLWDTGATTSTLSASIAKTLKLIPTGAIQMGHAGGQSTVPTHMVNVHLPNAVGIPGLLVTEIPDAPSFDMLIGMDVIGQGDFHLSHFNGQTCFSFRIPPMQAVDFVKEHDRIVYAGIRPNDPCPCGSIDVNTTRITKFKKCHGDGRLNA